MDVAPADRSPDSPEVLDVAALRRNFDDDMAFVSRLLTKFEGRYPAQIDAIFDALARRDGPAAGEAAHRLAGETSVFYANSARRIALDVEEHARAGHFAEADAACASLRGEIERLVSVVRVLPPGASAPGNSAPA